MDTVKKSQLYKRGYNINSVRLDEKLCILECTGMKLLNKYSKYISKCRLIDNDIL